MIIDYVVPWFLTSSCFSQKFSCCVLWTTVSKPCLLYCAATVFPFPAHDCFCNHLVKDMVKDKRKGGILPVEAAHGWVLRFCKITVQQQQTEQSLFCNILTWQWSLTGIHFGSSHCIIVRDVVIWQWHSSDCTHPTCSQVGSEGGRIGLF